MTSVRAQVLHTGQQFAMRSDADSSSESQQVRFAEIILPNEHDLSVLIQSCPRPPSGIRRSAAKVTLSSIGNGMGGSHRNLVQNPDPQVRASRAGVGIAAPIYTLLLSLVIAEAKRHDEPLPDAAFTTSGGRRRQTSGTATPSFVPTPQKHCTIFGFANNVY